MLRGFESEFPEKGDRLVCLRNNHDLGLLNGAIWTVLEKPHFDDGYVHIFMEDEEGLTQYVRCHKDPFLGEDISPWAVTDAESFDYGYALTVHKAQGSEWKKVIIFDESHGIRNPMERRCWKYTAITRASEEVLIVR